MIDFSIAIMSTTPGTKKNEITETKAYGTAQVRETLDLDKFADHICSHGCAYDKGDVVAILTKVVTCMREQILAGNKIVLGDLGGFYPELATEGAVTVDEFTVNNIKEVNVRWCPGEKFKDLREDAQFNLVPTRLQQAAQKKVITNQETIQGME